MLFVHLENQLQTLGLAQQLQLPALGLELVVKLALELQPPALGLEPVVELTQQLRLPALELEPVVRILQVMRSKPFHDAIADLPGYRTTACGEVKTIREVLQ